MPFSLDLWWHALPPMLGLALLGWIVSVPLRNVTIVDVLWSLLFVVAACSYAFGDAPLEPRAVLVVVLVSVWALRLALYLAGRTLGHGEDRRYAAIRRRNDPGFAWKSIYLVFGLQALLAWVISLPLLGATTGVQRPLGILDAVALVLWLVGMVFEAVGDWQLSRFKRDPANADRVMDRGLWRYTRHPNYFGDTCVWWAYFLFALANGAWWSVIGPVLMTVLLLRVSGVTLLEKHIGKRRPGYAEYIARTSAFIPRPPRD